MVKFYSQILMKFGIHNENPPKKTTDFNIQKNKKNSFEKYKLTQ